MSRSLHQQKTRPIALTIAGSDSSGGAGIQADLKTFSAFGVYGTSAITAVTAQNTTGVQAVSPIAPNMIAAQIDSVSSDLKIGAVKTGMLPNRDTIEIVANFAANAVCPVIVDPVMVATSGDTLVDPGAIDAIRALLLPVATLITPNLPEAAKLLGTNAATTKVEMEVQARSLMSLGASNVLVKGGHLSGETADDVLLVGGQVYWLEGRRVDTLNTHGTGCTLSSAIAAACACGRDLLEAARLAKDFLQEALTHADAVNVGAGSGPPDHLHAIKPFVVTE